MPEVTLNPGQAGLDFSAQGMRHGRYDANRSGHVTVEDPAHLKAIKLLGDTYNIGERVPVTADLPGWDCSCGFSAYRFQRTCPRCGDSRPNLEPAQ